MNLSSVPAESLKLAANTIRMLSAEAVEKANSGHPGMPMGMAEVGVALWLSHLRFNSADPKWLNRDRFVLSNGHGSMFLYSLLHLSGYAVSMEDIKAFRQWDSITPGHPESHMTPGVEATTGPLGQGVSNAVGMAIGQKLMAEHFNTDQHSIVNHRVFCIAGDGCLMEGVSGEGSSLAGHLGLGNLTVIYDDNHISIAGSTELAFSEDVAKRYEAYGWHVLRVDGHDCVAVDQAIAEAVAEDSRPSLICAKTIIGKGSPHKADTAGVHGSPLGADELQATREALGWNYEPFTVPDEVRQLFAARGDELAAGYSEWQKEFKAWREANAELARALDDQLALKIPSDIRAKLIGALPTDGKPAATRKLSGGVIQAASKEVPALVGGSADLEPSTYTLIKDETDFEKGAYSGRNLRFGVREHAMGAVMNGLAYYGGYIPYGSTFLCFADYMRPTIRLAALSHLPGLFIFTHDSIYLGEDGPTHQAVEHVSSLRMIPNLWVFRPADGVETAVCYEAALKRSDGPSALVFTRQNVPMLERSSDFSPDLVLRGAYSLVDSDRSPELVIAATGSEVELAVECAEQLRGSISVRVVSMPSWELFCLQDDAYRKQLFPGGVKTVSIEAGITFGWRDMIPSGTGSHLSIGVDKFGASAPSEVVGEKYGFTVDAVMEKIRAHMQQ